ncbi:MAG: hypothetical protein HYV75_08280, partial [Opitutae bacterium]|nr:hypothetical protein [Opitutae bacterium]
MFSPRLAAILAASLPRYNPAAPRPDPVIGDRRTEYNSDDSILRLPKL